jgi:hypothetical protein
LNLTATDEDGIVPYNIYEEKLTFYNNLSFAIDDIKENDNYYFSTTHNVGTKIWTTSFQFRPDNTMIGRYVISFSVEDLRREGMSFDINLTVMNVNDGPETPEIINPTTSLFYTNSRVPFKATCHDPDEEVDGSGEELNYTWSTSVKANEYILGYGEELTAQNMEIGNHTVTLTVRDMGGVTSEETIDIQIKSRYKLTKENADQTYTDDPLDLLRFRSDDGVKFEAGFSTL